MPYLPPYLMQQPLVMPQSPYASFGTTEPAPSAGFEKMEGESEAQYVTRLARTILPTTSELIAGKSPGEQIAVLTAQINQFQPYENYPVIGFWIKGHLDQNRARIAALTQEKGGDDLIQNLKLAGYGLMVIGAGAYSLYWLSQVISKSRSRR
jgi:hypothetical protein